MASLSQQVLDLQEKQIKSHQLILDVDHEAKRMERSLILKFQEVTIAMENFARNSEIDRESSASRLQVRFDKQGFTVHQDKPRVHPTTFMVPVDRMTTKTKRSKDRIGIKYISNYESQQRLNGPPHANNIPIKAQHDPD